MLNMPHSFLFISTGLPPDIGGPAGYVDRIARAAYDAGHRVGIIYYGDTPSIPGQYPFPVWRISRLPFPIKEILLFFRLALSGRQYSVWQANGGIPVTFPALVAARAFRRPIAVKVTGDYAWEEARNRRITRDGIDEFQVRRYGLRISLMKFLRSFVACHADLVIVPSDYLRRMAEGWGVPCERIVRIYNAVSSLPAAPIPRDPMLLFSAGRFVSWKGFDLLIRSFASLLPEFPQARLVIAGDGPLLSHIVSLIENMSLSSHVSCPGNLSSAVLHAQCRLARAFVLFSEYEGMSHVILEALSSRTPVIVSDAGGNRELVIHGKNGILVSSGDIDGLSLALRRILRRGPVSLSSLGIFRPDRHSLSVISRHTLAALSSLSSALP